MYELVLCRGRSFDMERGLSLVHIVRQVRQQCHLPLRVSVPCSTLDSCCSALQIQRRPPCCIRQHCRAIWLKLRHSGSQPWSRLEQCRCIQAVWGQRDRNIFQGMGEPPWLGHLPSGCHFLSMLQHLQLVESQCRSCGGKHPRSLGVAYHHHKSATSTNHTRD